MLEAGTSLATPSSEVLIGGKKTDRVISEELDLWAYLNGVVLRLLAARQADGNAFAESFNGNSNRDLRAFAQIRKFSGDQNAPKPIMMRNARRWAALIAPGSTPRSDRSPDWRKDYGRRPTCQLGRREQRGPYDR